MRLVTLFAQRFDPKRLVLIAPDAHWVAHVSNEAGRNEVYVHTFPRAGGKSGN